MRTRRLLAAHSLRSPDPDAIDDSRKTVTDLFGERGGVPEGLELACTRLLEAVTLANEESLMEGPRMDTKSRRKARKRRWRDCTMHDEE
jgi:hypothetical protein